MWHARPVPGIYLNLTESEHVRLADAALRRGQRTIQRYLRLCAVEEMERGDQPKRTKRQVTTAAADQETKGETCEG